MPISVLIAMPTMGSIHTNAVKSLVGLTQLFRTKGISFSFSTHEFSDIVVSRNQLLSQFHQDDKFTHILLLDSDIAYRPETVLRMLEFNEDFVTAPYAQKFIPWGKIRQKIEEDAALPEDERREVREILNESWVYNTMLVSFERKIWVPETRDGFITCPATGTGMMLLTRRVPQVLIENGQAKNYPAHMGKARHKGVEFYDFFSHLTSNDGSAFYGEDQSFCMRWSYYCQEKIWLDTEAILIHEGSYKFESQLGDHDLFSNP